MNKSHTSCEDVLSQSWIRAYQSVLTCGDQNEDRSELLMNGSFIAKFPAPDAEFDGSKE